ncbi:MAG: AAA family ATPase [Opitutaceae bacterium]
MWSDQAVGILGGEPKCCKSFLALDLAVSVAAGVACLRRYPVRHPGRVLLFPAEDALGIVRQRLQGAAFPSNIRPMEDRKPRAAPRRSCRLHSSPEPNMCRPSL